MNNEFFKNSSFPTNGDESSFSTNESMFGSAITKELTIAEKLQQKLDRLGIRKDNASLEEGTYTLDANGNMQSNENKIWNNLNANDKQQYLGGYIANQQLEKRADGKTYYINTGKEYTGDTRRLYAYGTNDPRYPDEIKIGLSTGKADTSDVRYSQEAARKAGLNPDSWRTTHALGVDTKKNQMDMLLPWEVATQAEAVFHGNKQALANRTAPNQMSSEYDRKGSGGTEYYKDRDEAIGTYNPKVATRTNAEILREINSAGGKNAVSNSTKIEQKVQSINDKYDRIAGVADRAVNTVKAGASMFAGSLYDLADLGAEAIGLDLGTEEEKRKNIHSITGYKDVFTREAGQKISANINDMKKNGVTVEKVWDSLNTAIQTPELLGESIGFVASMAIGGQFGAVAKIDKARKALTAAKAVGKIDDVAYAAGAAKLAEEASKISAVKKGANFVTKNAGWLGTSAGMTNNDIEAYAQNAGIDKSEVSSEKIVGSMLMNLALNKLDYIVDKKLLSSPEIASGISSLLVGATKKQVAEFGKGIGIIGGAVAIGGTAEAGTEYAQTLMEQISKQYGEQNAQKIADIWNNEENSTERLTAGVMGFGGAQQMNIASASKPIYDSATEMYNLVKGDKPFTPEQINAQSQAERDEAKAYVFHADKNQFTDITGDPVEDQKSYQKRDYIVKIAAGAMTESLGYQAAREITGDKNIPGIKDIDGNELDLKTATGNLIHTMYKALVTSSEPEKISAQVGVANAMIAHSAKNAVTSILNPNKIDKKFTLDDRYAMVDKVIEAYGDELTAEQIDSLKSHKHQAAIKAWGNKAVAKSNKSGSEQSSLNIDENIGDVVSGKNEVKTSVKDLEELIARLDPMGSINGNGPKGPNVPPTGADAEALKIANKLRSYIDKWRALNPKGNDGEEIDIDLSQIKTIDDVKDEIREYGFIDIISDSNKASIKNHFARIQDELLNGDELVLTDKDSKEVVTKGSLSKLERFQNGRIKSVQGNDNIMDFEAYDKVKDHMITPQKSKDGKKGKPYIPKSIMFEAFKGRTKYRPELDYSKITLRARIEEADTFIKKSEETIKIIEDIKLANPALSKESIVNYDLTIGAMKRMIATQSEHKRQYEAVKQIMDADEKLVDAGKGNETTIKYYTTVRNKDGILLGYRLKDYNGAKDDQKNKTNREEQGKGGQSSNETTSGTTTSGGSTQGREGTSSTELSEEEIAWLEAEAAQEADKEKANDEVEVETKEPEVNVEQKNANLERATELKNRVINQFIFRAELRNGLEGLQDGIADKVVNGVLELLKKAGRDDESYKRLAILHRQLNTQILPKEIKSKIDSLDGFIRSMLTEPDVIEAALNIKSTSNTAVGKMRAFVKNFVNAIYALAGITPNNIYSRAIDNILNLAHENTNAKETKKYKASKFNESTLNVVQEIADNYLVVVDPKALKAIRDGGVIKANGDYDKSGIKNLIDDEKEDMNVIGVISQAIEDIGKEFRKVLNENGKRITYKFANTNDEYRTRIIETLESMKENPNINVPKGFEDALKDIRGLVEQSNDIKENNEATKEEAGTEEGTETETKSETQEEQEVSKEPEVKEEQPDPEVVTKRIKDTEKAEDIVARLKELAASATDRKNYNSKIASEMKDAIRKLKEEIKSLMPKANNAEIQRTLDAIESYNNELTDGINDIVETEEELYYRLGQYFSESSIDNIKKQMFDKDGNVDIKSFRKALKNEINEIKNRTKTGTIGGLTEAGRTLVQEIKYIKAEENERIYKLQELNRINKEFRNNALNSLKQNKLMKKLALKQAKNAQTDIDLADKNAEFKSKYAEKTKLQKELDIIAKEEKANNEKIKKLEETKKIIAAKECK